MCLELLRAADVHTERRQPELQSVASHRPDDISRRVRMGIGAPSRRYLDRATRTNSGEFDNVRVSASSEIDERFA